MQIKFQRWTEVKKVKVNVRTLIAVTMFTLALSGAALAQSYRQTVRANIPFSFYANGKLQSAGTYDFAMNLEAHSIAMSSEDSGKATFLGGAPEDGTSRASAILTFVTNEGGAYVLQSAQWPDSGVAFNVRRAPGRSVHAQASNATQTVIAQLR